MQTNTQTVRAFRPQYFLWKFTFISAILHALVIGGLCGFSYMQAAKKEEATKAKQAEQDALVAKNEAAEAAKNPAPPAAAPASAPAAVPVASNASTPAPAPEKAPVASAPAPAPTAPAQPPPIDPNAPVQAEKVLGIDKVAKPEETPKSPFAGKDDDLLKDLK